MWLFWTLLPAAVYLVTLSLVIRAGGTGRAKHGTGPLAERHAKRSVLACLGLGVLAALPVGLVERGAASLVGISPKEQVTGAWAAILASLLLFAPLEEGAKALAGWPVIRGRAVRGPREAIGCASAVATGFSTVESLSYLLDTHRAGLLVGAGGVLALARLLLAVVARLFCAAVWGYAAGRNRELGKAPFGGYFLAAWACAAALKGLYDHLAFGRGLAALLGVTPLFVGMLWIAVGARRELVPKELPSPRRSGRLSSRPPAPTLAVIRDALRRAERPVMLRWILLGTLVTSGVVITCVVGVVVTAKRLGVDFSAMDQEAAGYAVPLVLIGLGGLVAFPVSGFLIARASGTNSVLEPALSAAAAIAGALVMLGLAEPVALIFAIAFAPVAFALACAGAWTGIGGPR